jgi:hypothetical protein
MMAELSETEMIKANSESKKINGNESTHSKQSILSVFDNQRSKPPILFAVQTVLIFTVVIAAIINLSINSHDDPNSKLWIMLLSGCVGYFLPNPSIKLLPKIE